MATAVATPSTDIRARWRVSRRPFVSSQTSSSDSGSERTPASRTADGRAGGYGRGAGAVPPGAVESPSPRSGDAGRPAGDLLLKSRRRLPPPDAPPRGTPRGVSFLHNVVQDIDAWCHMFAARAARCHRLYVRFSTLGTVLSGALALIATVRLADEDRASAIGTALHVVVMFLGVLLVGVETALRVCEWQNGAAQCRLAAQRCVGLRGRVIAEMSAWPGGETTRRREQLRAVECLGLVIEELQQIHASDATRFLGGHQLVMPLGQHDDDRTR